MTNLKNWLTKDHIMVVFSKNWIASVGWIGSAFMVAFSFTLALPFALIGLTFLTVQAIYNRTTNLILLNLISLLGFIINSISG